MSFLNRIKTRLGSYVRQFRPGPVMRAPPTATAATPPHRQQQREQPTTEPATTTTTTEATNKTTTAHPYPDPTPNPSQPAPRPSDTRGGEEAVDPKGYVYMREEPIIVEKQVPTNR